MIYLPLILLGVLLNAAAQLCLKEGMRRIGHFDFVWANVLPIGMQVAGNVYVLAGLFLYVVSVAVWLLVLSRVEVSFAYPLLSFSGEPLPDQDHRGTDHHSGSIFRHEKLMNS